MSRFSLMAVLIVALLLPAQASAGDGVTIVLENGVRVFFNNGYKQLVKGMQDFNTKGSHHYIVEVNIEGSTFYIDVAKVAIVCRDECNSLRIVEPPRR